MFHEQTKDLVSYPPCTNPRVSASDGVLQLLPFPGCDSMNLQVLLHPCLTSFQVPCLLDFSLNLMKQTWFKEKKQNKSVEKEFLKEMLIKSFNKIQIIFNYWYIEQSSENNLFAPLDYIFKVTYRDNNHFRQQISDWFASENKDYVISISVLPVMFTVQYDLLVLRTAPSHCCDILFSVWSGTTLVAAKFWIWNVSWQIQV